MAQPDTTELNPLEASFAKIAAANNLTRLGIEYCGEECPDYRFGATGWYDNAAPGQIGCSSGYEATIEGAILAMLAKVASCRAIALHGDDALMDAA